MMIKLKVLLSFSAVLCFVAADVAPARVVQPIHGVPKPLPRPTLVRPVPLTSTTEVTRVEEIPTATEPLKDTLVRKPRYPQRYSNNPPQRVNLRARLTPTGAPRPYPKPTVVSTLIPSNKVVMEKLPVPLREESLTEETQVVDVTEKLQESSTAPILESNSYSESSGYEARPFIRPIPVVSTLRTIAPEVTEPTRTTVIESQSIVIEEVPVESGIEWASSQPTMDELQPLEILTPEPIPETTAAPIKSTPRPKPRPKFSVKPKLPVYKPMADLVEPKAVKKPVAEVRPLVKPSSVVSSGWTCLADNGYFPVEQDCDSYIECKKNIATEYICPDGLHFNPETVWPNYPCGYPTEVNCAGRTMKQAPRPTEECPRQYGFFPMDGIDCSKYVMCQEGKATIMSCPPGLAFSEAVSSCDWPENVPTCNPNVFQGFVCPETPLEEDGDLILNYRYGDSCKSYVACQRGRPRLLSCDEGFSFDYLSGRCIDSDYVKNCEL